MTDMIRKQIYISRRQQALLKHLSRQSGLSEAEIVRKAIDREAEKILPQPNQASEQTWQEALAFMRSLRDRTALYTEPVHWNRTELYTERMNRLFEDRSKYSSHDKGQPE